MISIIEYAAGSLIAIVLVTVVVLHKRSYNLNPSYFSRKWRRLQTLCSDKKKWCQAIIKADELLDEALKKKHFKGHTAGERLVAAQRYFSANDAVWLSHKLTNRIKEEDLKKLTKKQTIEALATFRSALKDLGAFGTEGKPESKQ